MTGPEFLAWRNRLRLSSRDAATALGISRGLVSVYERTGPPLTVRLAMVAIDIGARDYGVHGPTVREADRRRDREDAERRAADARVAAQVVADRTAAERMLAEARRLASVRSGGTGGYQTVAAPQVPIGTKPVVPERTNVTPLPRLRW